MADGIQQAGQKLAEQAAEQAAEQKGSSAPQSPDSEDVTKFNEAMQKPAAEGGGDVGAVDGTQAPEEKGPAKGLGEKMLEGMEKLKGSHEEKQAAINELVAQEGDMSTQDAMKLQHELMKLHLQTDMTTKAADKSSQGVQTMMKNQ